MSVRSFGRIRQIAYLVDNLDASAGSKVAYFACPDVPGILFEFIRVVPAIQQAFDAGVAASRDWDGGEPILTAIDFAAV